MEYRKYVQGSQFENVVDVAIPDMYNNVDPDYNQKLAKRKAELKKRAKSNNKRKKLLFPLLGLSLFAAILLVAMIVELILGCGFKYILVTAAASIVASLTIASQVAQNDAKKRKEEHEKACASYENDSTKFKANAYLFHILQYTKVLNLIMSNGRITVSYIGAAEKMMCDTFTYEEWKDDENLDTPFLLFESNRLFGRSNVMVESTTFTTNVIE